MSGIFDLDSFINDLIDRHAEQLKDRIKKGLVRHEKLLLKQFVASQKATTQNSVSKPKTQSTKLCFYPPR